MFEINVVDKAKSGIFLSSYLTRNEEEVFSTNVIVKTKATVEFLRVKLIEDELLDTSVAILRVSEGLSLVTVEGVDIVSPEVEDVSFYVCDRSCCRYAFAKSNFKSEHWNDITVEVLVISSANDAVVFEEIERTVESRTGVRFEGL